MTRKYSKNWVDIGLNWTKIRGKSIKIAGRTGEHSIRKKKQNIVYLKKKTFKLFDKHQKLLKKTFKIKKIMEKHGNIKKNIELYLFLMKKIKSFQNIYKTHIL